MASNYNNTAWFYDALSKVVFGNSIRNSQIALLKFIPAKSNVLIVGGGTGWILEEVAKVHNTGLNITYVEVSAKMTELSQKRHAGDNKVNFINNAVENIELAIETDVIITPFLFDNFTQAEAQVLFKHMHRMLKSKGYWLLTDFQVAGKWWHWPLLQSMYLFFKLFKAVEVNRLPDVLSEFKQHGYSPCCRLNFYSDFITSSVQQKPA